MMETLLQTTVRKKVQVATFSNASLASLQTAVNSNLITLFDYANSIDIMSVIFYEAGGVHYAVIVYYNAWQHTPDEL